MIQTNKWGKSTALPSRSPVDVEKKGNTTVIIVANKMHKLVGRKLRRKPFTLQVTILCFPL